MNRTFLTRGLVLIASSVALIVGCSAGTPTEGDLPATRVGTPDEFKNLQKKLEQEKVGKDAAYKKPPGVNIPRQ